MPGGLAGGARVASTGAILDDLPLAIPSGRLAWNGATYVLVHAGAGGLQGRTISATGAVGAEVGIATAQPTSLDVASRGTTSVVVWSTAGEVRGAVLDADASVLATDLPISIELPGPPRDVRIAAGTGDYLVVWSDGVATPDLYGARVREDAGTLSCDPLLAVATTTSDELTPALAVGSDGTYLVVHTASLLADGNAVAAPSSPGVCAGAAPSCAVANGGCEQTCTEVGGLPVCGCGEGMTLAPDRHACVPYDRCTNSVGVRACEQICTNLAGGGFTCACFEGFFPDRNNCEDLDECREGIADCHAQAACVNTEGSYECACRAGYRGDGWTCEPESDEDNEAPGDDEGGCQTGASRSAWGCLVLVFLVLGRLARRERGTSRPST